MISGKAPKGWNDDVVPLLMQGFKTQSINLAAAKFVDKQQFTLTQNRGVVIGLDYVSGNLIQFVNGVTEDIWNDATISTKAGGQDLLVNEAAERYDYALDLGTDEETLIHTRLEGGQIIESALEISPASFATFPTLQTQLIAYYSTERLEEWRSTLKFPAGTGVKRQDFVLNVEASASLQYKFSDVLPKNQGPIIGVSFLAMSNEIFNWNLTFSVDGIAIVENVNCLRFSRRSQREPFILFYPFEAGSRFEAILDLDAAITTNDGAFFMTFYFAN